MKRALLVIALMAAPLLGDEVYLKGGGQISGQIVAQDDKTVAVDIGGGTLGVQMSTVVRIEKTTSPLQEYRARAAKLDRDDLDGWRELARWVENQALANQAREAWMQVDQIAPGDPEANRALGRVELNGEWVSEEESYLARGFVDFEGEWMTPDERQSIVAARQAQEEADRRELQEQILAHQQAEYEREAREQAEHDAYWNSLPMYGDPLYYGGYGGGAVYWPTVPARPIAGNRPNRPAQLPARGRVR